MAPVPDRPSARSGTDVPRLGRYRVCYRIAQGGMASVYLARLDTTVGFSKWVALKIIHPNIATDERFLARQRESILSAEGDTHLRLRRLVAPAFAPRWCSRPHPRLHW